MKYKLLSGILYGAKDSAPLAKIRGSVCGPEKEITGADGAPLYTSEIKLLDAPAGHSGEVTYHKYALTSADGSCIEASPAYNPEFDPAADGWPLCRLPRADRAMLALGSALYTLIMQNTQNYVLQNAAGAVVARIVHRGVTGGWDIDAPSTMSAGLVCGLYVFSRYLERENEFLTV